MQRTLTLLFAALLIQAAPLFAATPQPVLADANALAGAVARNAIVWDVRAADAFARGHVPGAVNLGDAAAVLREPTTEDFIATAQIENLLGAAGIDPAREVVVYGSRGGWQRP